MHEIKPNKAIKLRGLKAAAPKAEAIFEKLKARNETPKYTKKFININSDARITTAGFFIGSLYHLFCGAGAENRTRTSNLEGSYSTIKPRPQ